MKQHVLIVGLVFVLFASACAPQATPTADPVNVQQSAEAAAFTMVAETQQAAPTATPVPPTDTPAPVALPTNTPLPTSDIQGALPTLTGLPTFTAPPPQSNSS